MRWTLPLVATLAALVLPGSATSQQVHKPVLVIDDDEGGYIADHLKFYARIRDSGIPVRIRGLCVSACTLVLTLPYEQTCIEPTASLGFHAASAYGRINLDYTRVLITRYYPQAVQDFIAAWMDKNGALTDKVFYMSAAQAVELGVMRACEAV